MLGVVLHTLIPKRPTSVATTIVSIVRLVLVTLAQVRHLEQWHGQFRRGR